MTPEVRAHVLRAAWWELVFGALPELAIERLRREGIETVEQLRDEIGALKE